MSAKSTSKARTTPKDDLRAEYRREDLGTGVRGKYLKQVQSGSNLVLLAPDVAQVFKTEDSVNDALRSLIDVARLSVRPAPRARASRAKAAVSTKRS